MAKNINSWALPLTDFLGEVGSSQITADGDCSHEIKRHFMTNLNSILKSRGITLPTKVHLVKAMVFSCSHIWMWELDYKESWAPKNWCFWIEVLEKTLESPWDCKEIKPVNPKGNQSWIFTGRTDAEAEIPILGPPDVKSQLIWKDLDAGKDGGQEEKGATEDEMIGWHYIHNGHEFEQTPGDSEGHGSLACCSPWGCKSQTWLSDYTTTKGRYSLKFVFKRWVTFKK